MLGYVMLKRAVVSGARLLSKPIACASYNRIFINQRSSQISQLSTTQRFKFHHSCSAMTYSTVQKGSANTFDFRVYFKDSDGTFISPFHDIPMFHSQQERVYNMVVEVPRWTNAKMEINTKERLNPIIQDVKKDKLRFVHNVFPHHGYIWNYGAIPRTWEDPKHKDDSTGCMGDGDPIDVCEIGSKVAAVGDVLRIKVLGVLALIDEGETDWKVIAIDITDPIATKLNDIEDVEKHFPGYLKATHEWFKIYKMPDNKPANEFAFNGEIKNREYAEAVIRVTHISWRDVVTGLRPNDEGLALECVKKLEGTHLITKEESAIIVSEQPEPGTAAPVCPSVNEWHYIQL